MIVPGMLSVNRAATREMQKISFMNRELSSEQNFL
jgi:hypothetical protein